MVMNTVRSRVFLYGLLLTAAYFGLALIVPSRFLYTAFNGLFMGVTFAVVTVYWPLFWRSIRELPFNRASHVAVGIGLIWLAMTFSRLLSIYNRVVHPELVSVHGSILNNPFTGYIALLGIVGGILHITGASMDADGRITRSRGVLFICVLLGVLFAIITALVQGAY